MNILFWAFRVRGPERPKQVFQSLILIEWCVRIQYQFNVLIYRFLGLK